MGSLFGLVQICLKEHQMDSTGTGVLHKDTSQRVLFPVQHVGKSASSFLADVVARPFAPPMPLPNEH